ncbi:agmatinase [Caulobacter sp. 1776]|uniref:agmatinase n=1 Tax=Caulobacter sp. 1776 TaxID=3156420 RepID=UPI0033952FF4
MTTISLLGAPHDDYSSHLKGAAAAPGPIREALWSEAYGLVSETRVDLGQPGRLVDHGDVIFGEGIDPWDAIEARVGEVLQAGHPLICLGGDHAVSHPILRAVRRRHPRLTIVHIDAHSDLYDVYQGNPRSHACPFARIMEEGLADRLIQIGIRCVNPHHDAQIARFGVEVVEAYLWRRSLPLRLDGPVYISLDLDALDPAFAPGVSHPEPGGLSTRQVIDIIQAIDQPIVGADIVEYNPSRDVNGLTAGVVAKLLKEVAGMMVRTNAS